MHSFETNIPSLEPNTRWEEIALSNFPVSSNSWTLILLEAWRRGLEVVVSKNRCFSISSTQTRHDFRMNRLASPEAAEGTRICNDKHQTKRYFELNDLPAPAGKFFSAPIDKHAILNEAQNLGYPLCLKAANWSKGKGVYPNITSKEQLTQFVDTLVDQLHCKSIVLEEHFDGKDFRFFVVDDKVSAVIQRIPANITGDGESTIEQLIERKNALRAENPYLKSAPIQVDAEVEYILAQQGYSLTSVPLAGHTLFLREKSNASAGGDTIDVTNDVSETSKSLAISAIKAIPGIHHGGVDMLLKGAFTTEEESRLIEINQSAEMGIHLYPSYGKGTYPPKDLVDFYFPQHSIQDDARYLYFDLRSVLTLLKTGTADAVVVAPLPDTSNIVWRQITFTGQVQGVGFRKWFVKKAREISIHGEVMNKASGEVVLRVCGKVEDLNALVATIENHGSPATIQTVLVEQIPPFNTYVGVRIV